MIQQKKIIRINASALKNASCLRRLWLDVIEGYKPQKNGNDIEYGQSFHKFTRALSEGKDLPSAMQEAHEHFNNTPMYIVKSGQWSKNWLNIGHLTMTCHDFYTKIWSQPKQMGFELLRENEIPLTEKQFSIPIYSDSEYDVLLQGTIDLIGRIDGGAYVFGDYKTTTFWDKEAFFLPYKMSTQLATYTYALRYHADHYPESIIGRMLDNGRRLGCFIYGVFLSKDKPSEFIRSDVWFYPQQWLDEYEMSLQFLVKRLLNHTKLVDELYMDRIDSLPVKEGLLNGACRGEFGMCKYFNACASPDDRSFDAILRGDFIRQEYKPLREK